MKLTHEEYQALYDITYFMSLVPLVLGFVGALLKRITDPFNKYP